MRRITTLLLLSALAVLAGLAPAAAGGPTSVLLSAPGESRATGLYYTDPAYDRLVRAVGVGRRVEPADDPGNFRSGPPITLTWLIHDVMIWRIDQIYVHRGTTYVLTQENAGGDMSNATSVLHEAGPGLVPLLERLLPPGSGDLRDPAVAPADTPSAAPTAPAEQVAAKPAAVSKTSPVLLTGLGGLLVGVLGTLTAGAVRRPRDASDPSPAAARDELVWP